jgi:hypothetical protein
VNGAGEEEFTTEAQRTQRGRAASKDRKSGFTAEAPSTQRNAFVGKIIRTQRPPRLRGEFSISSQLANNFDYCSAEFGKFLSQKLFTPRPQRLCGAVRASVEAAMTIRR